jgi:hypothetical protein
MQPDVLVIDMTEDAAYLIADGLGFADVPINKVGPGVPMVEHPAVNRGRPTSLWDLIWVRKNGPLPADHHALLYEGKWSVVSNDDLHEADRRGRPSLYSWQQARAIRNSYHEGRSTIRDMACMLKTTETTVARIVHGLTYWYA